jgi:hypothetical protein
MPYRGVSAKGCMPVEVPKGPKAAPTCFWRRCSMLNMSLELTDTAGLSLTRTVSRKGLKSRLTCVVPTCSEIALVVDSFCSHGCALVCASGISTSGTWYRGTSDTSSTKRRTNPS